MEQKINVVEGFDGRKIVFIHDIIFKKKQYVDWKDVRDYLKRYVGEYYTVLSSQDKIYIGSDFPNEYSGSVYTYSLKGTNVKAKANAVQGIPEMIEIATGGNYRKIRRRSMSAMLNMDGIVMILILVYQYVEIMEK